GRAVRRVAAAVGDGAGVERVHAREDLDERRFPGAVLAQQGDDFAGADVYTCIDEGLRAAKVLRHAAHGQQRLARLGRDVARGNHSEIVIVDDNEDGVLLMRLIAAAVAVAAALSAQAGAQETKPVPKDSMRVT